MEALWCGPPPNVDLLVSQTVLQYSAAFDPNAVAVSDNGSVATVGKRIYSTTFVGNFDSLLTADALGRFFAPLGGASVVGDAADAQMSVAIDADGVISTATLDSGTSHIQIARYNSSPGEMLAALCAEASGHPGARAVGALFSGRALPPGVRWRPTRAAVADLRRESVRRSRAAAVAKTRGSPESTNGDRYVELGRRSRARLGRIRRVDERPERTPNGRDPADLSVGGPELQARWQFSVCRMPAQPSNGTAPNRPECRAARNTSFQRGRARGP